MDKQGKKIDAMMSLPIASGLIMSRKQFKKIAHYKNDVQFYKTFSRIVALLIVAGVLHLIYFLVMEFVFSKPSIFGEQRLVLQAFSTLSIGPISPLQPSLALPFQVIGQLSLIVPTLY